MLPVTRKVTHSVEHRELINLELLIERVDNDTQLLAEMLSLFLSTCPKLLEQIREAIVNRWYESLHSMGHILKGICQNLCADHMQALAARLESYDFTVDANHSSTELSEILVQLESEFEAMRKDVNAFLDRNKLMA